MTEVLTADMSKEQVRAFAEPRAAELLEELKARGLPVQASAVLDHGWKIGMAFRLSSGARWATHGPTQTVTADQFHEEFLKRDRVPQ